LAHGRAASFAVIARREGKVAEAVRTIFARYLELGSVRALAQDLDRRGIRSKRRRLSNGRTIGGGRTAMLWGPRRRASRSPRSCAKPRHPESHVWALSRY